MKKIIVPLIAVILSLFTLFAFTSCSGIKRGGNGVFVGCVTLAQNDTVLLDKTYHSFTGEQWCTFILKPDEVVTVTATSEDGVLDVLLTTDANYSKGTFSRRVEPGKPCSFVYATHGKRTSCKLTFSSEGTQGSFHAEIGKKAEGMEDGITDNA